MTKQPPKPPLMPGGPSKPKVPADKAFDTWLTRGLHQIFDDVAREPIPDNLLKMIEDDRENS